MEVTHSPSLSLRAYLTLVRLAGYFPYSWRNTSLCSLGEKAKCNISLQKSWTWRLWSYFVLSVLMSLMSFDVYSSIVHARAAVNDYETLKFFHIIYDVITAMSVQLIQLLCFLKSETLGRLITNNFRITYEWHHGLQSSQNWASPKLNWLTVLLILVELAAIALALISYLAYDTSQYDGLTLVLLCVRFTATAMQMCILGTTFSYFIGSIEDHITFALRDLAASLDASDLDSSSPAVDEENSTNYSNKISNIRNLCRVKKVQPQPTEIDFNFYEVKKEFWDAFCSLRHLTCYMGNISIIIFSQLMFTFLVTTVYATLMDHLGPSLKQQLASHILLAVFPIAFLANLPTSLIQNVADLKWMLTRLTLKPSMKKHREQILELKSLLDECPTFEMSSVFTLSRSKIVNIVSFVATYVVIFLQFTSTENASSPSVAVYCNCSQEQ